MTRTVWNLNYQRYYMYYTLLYYHINPFIPQNLDIFINANRSFSVKLKKKEYIMSNSIDPDETVCDKPSHQDLHCLHRYPFWSAGLKGLTLNIKTSLFFIILYLKIEQ